MTHSWIDSDGLAAAVAKDRIGATMMDGLAGLQLQGLAMWPEDAHHISSGTLLLSPSAFKAWRSVHFRLTLRRA